MADQTGRVAQDAVRATRAWQDSAQTLGNGYGEQWRRFADQAINGGAFPWLQQGQIPQPLRRIIDETAEVTRAQFAVAGEWMRAPFWLSGAASPSDLQASYVRLFEAQRKLFRAYVEETVGWQQSLFSAGQRTAEQVEQAVDAQTRTAERIARDARATQQASVDAARATARAGQQAAEQTVNAAAEAAQQAVRQAERPIKGNINSRGEKIYHVPGQVGYEDVRPEITFATEEEAREAGFRHAPR